MILLLYSDGKKAEASISISKSLLKYLGKVFLVHEIISISRVNGSRTLCSEQFFIQRA